LKLLAKKPEQRPQTFHEILIELKKLKVYKSIVEKEDEDGF